MATEYSLDVMHNGTDYGDICIYQTCDANSDNIRSLVWFAKSAHPGTELKFRWFIDYSFAWSETGELNPGVIFTASQVIQTDPSDTTVNTIGFVRDRDAYTFTKIDNPTKQGKLGIACDASIPSGCVSIGVGMSGKSAYACLASPSLKYTFSPHPRYWIAFGKFEEGEVIDVNRMTQRYEIKYPVNVYSRKVQLRADNTWDKA